MKKVIFLILVLALLLVRCASDSGKDIEGIWEGKLKFPGIEMRIIFKISGTSDGTLKAFMVRPELGDPGKQDNPRG